MQTVQDIQTLCTSIIWQCTAQHAAANFSMYDEYAFAPNYPAKLEGDPPMDKVRVMFVLVFVSTFLPLATNIGLLYTNGFIDSLFCVSFYLV